MSPEERDSFCKENKITSALPKIILTGYSILHLIHFFTAGPDEVRCWTIRQGTKAPHAGAVIHTDFEKGFICVETFKYDDFKKYGSEKAVKEAGKMVSNGKEYIVQDGDILLFVCSFYLFFYYYIYIIILFKFIFILLYFFIYIYVVNFIFIILNYELLFRDSTLIRRNKLNNCFYEEYYSI